MSVKMPTRKVSFPKHIRDWNILPDSIISSAELSDDCVSKFTSLVRARDQSSSANPLVGYCHFGVSPVNYFDSDSERFSPVIDIHVCRILLTCPCN